MSGPPPWTTIGFIPTYLSSTTSRAKSSRSAGSSIAAPPYLMTTVLPWNSRMYGSASRSVPTSLTSLRSCRVLGVDGHVAVAEVGEEDLRLGPVAGQADDVLDLVALHPPAQVGRVVRRRLAGGAHLHALDRDVERQRSGAHERSADRLRDPAPVRVAAVERCLDQRRVRHGAGRALDVAVRAAANYDAPGAGGALAVS